MPALQAAGGTAIAGENASGTSVGRLRALAYGLGAAGVLADQLAKNAALVSLDPLNPPMFLGGWLRLQLVRNPGAAFSMGENLTVVLTCIAIAALGFVGGYLVPRVRHPGWAVAEGLLLAGIVGNLIDRLFREPGPFHGHVIDFLQVPYFAIFNVADICITAAAILIIWFVLIRQVNPDGTSARPASKPAAPADA